MAQKSFSVLEAEFIDRVHRMVWCNVATIDRQGRPRSRVLHTIWEGPVGWLATRRQSPKALDLDLHPYVSLAYIADIVHPVYADCAARWEDEPAIMERIWELFRTTPPPLGYDPATIFTGVSDSAYGLLRLDPYRIALEDVSGQGARRQIWQTS